MSRDCLMYGVAVLSLIVVLSDGIVMWYEALGLVLGYVLYIGGEKKRQSVYMKVIAFIKTNFQLIIIKQCTSTTAFLRTLER